MSAENQTERPTPSEAFDAYLAEVVTDEAKRDPDWLAKARTGWTALADASISVLPAAPGADS